MRKRLSAVLGAAVALLLALHSINEYGPDLKNNTDIILKRLCAINPGDRSWEVLFATANCQAVFRPLDLYEQMHQYFDDPCQLGSSEQLDHLECADWWIVAALVKLPAAWMFLIADFYVRDPLIATILTAIPTTIVWANPYFWRDFVAWSRRRFGARPGRVRAAGIVVGVLEAYLYLTLAFVFVSAAAAVVHAFLAHALALTSGIVGFAVWISTPSALLFLILRTPLGVYEIYDDIKSFINKAFRRKKS